MVANTKCKHKWIRTNVASIFSSVRSKTAVKNAQSFLTLHNIQSGVSTHNLIDAPNPTV